MNAPCLGPGQWSSCIPPCMKWCQCLGGPGSGASCTPADPGTGLWLRRPHLAHETPNRGQRDERVLQQTTPQHWLVLQRALLALAVALFRQPYWWHDTMWIWLKGRRVVGDGWQTEREEKQVEKERLMIQFVWKNLVKLLLKCRPTPWPLHRHAVKDSQHTWTYWWFSVFTWC